MFQSSALTDFSVPRPGSHAVTACSPAGGWQADVGRGLSADNWVGAVDASVGIDASADTDACSWVSAAVFAGQPTTVSQRTGAYR
jgi:hypothetical protein